MTWLPSIFSHANAIQQGGVDDDVHFEGIVVAGSWDPTQGTCYVTRGDTAAIFSDSGDLPLPLQVYVETNQIGDQYGPVGAERVQVRRCQSGYKAHFEHGPDDTPQAPSGERWIMHRSIQVPPDSPPVWDAWTKHTNDGPTPGDGMGGAHYGGNAALTQATSKGGHVIACNDATGQVTVHANTPTASQQNKVYSIYDAAGNVLSHVAPSVGVGDLFENLSADVNAAVRLTDLAQQVANLKVSIGNVAQQIAQAAVLSGVPNAGPFLALIQGGLPSLTFANIASTVAPILIPGCSPTVFIK